MDAAPVVARRDMAQVHLKLALATAQTWPYHGTGSAERPIVRSVVAPLREAE